MPASVGGQTTARRSPTLNFLRPHAPLSYPSNPTSLTYLCVISGVLIHLRVRVGLCSHDLETARRDIAAVLAEADPDRVTAAQAATLLTLFADIERLGAAGKVLFSKRAAESTIWRDEGHRSAASWMAEKTRTAWVTPSQPSRRPQRLQLLPDTTEALRRGELSGPQVKVIAAAGGATRRTENELLQAAATRSLKGLTARAAEVRAAAALRTRGEDPPAPSTAPGTCGTGPTPTGPSASTPSSPPGRGQAPVRSQGRGRRPLPRGPEVRGPRAPRRLPGRRARGAS